MPDIWITLSMLFSILVPISLFLFLLIRFLSRCKTGIRAVLIGAATFFVFALLLEQLLHLYLLRINPITAVFLSEPLPYAIYGGLAAGIFEETGRLLSFQLFFRREGMQDWAHGIAYGMGHGGLEVLLIGGELSFLYLSELIRATQSADIRQMLINMPASSYLAGGIERIFAFTIQIGLSLLVLYAVSRRRYVFYALAVALHAIVDGSSVYLGKSGVMIWQIELLLAAYAALAFFWILRSRRIFQSIHHVKRRLS